MTPGSARLDHVVVVVPTLAEGTARFTGAGFTVTPGGSHDAIPTENALVGFADGTYLELLATRDPALREELRGSRGGAGWERHLKGVSAVARRFLPVLAGPDGVADWVMASRSLGRAAAALRALGVKASGPVRMARERTDGVRLEWELLLPESPLHPFWIADRTPREQRVPGGDATRHANGATGVAAVRVHATVVPSAALELGEVLGAVPRMRVGVSTLELDGVRIEFEAGESQGASGVMLTGCASLPDDITSLGVTS